MPNPKDRKFATPSVTQFTNEYLDTCLTAMRDEMNELEKTGIVCFSQIPEKNAPWRPFSAEKKRFHDALTKRRLEIWGY